MDAEQAIQLVDQQIPATLETCHRRRYRVLRSGEGRQSRELYERRSTGGTVDDQRRHALDQRRRQHAEAKPPARHGVGL